MKMRYSKCPVCASEDIQASISFRAPVFANVLYASHDEAVAAPQGDFSGAYCNRCGHFFNCIFDEELLEYTEDYDTSLHFSASFQNYAEALAQHLISTYGLHNKSIIEIGCGRGDFLKMLCEGQGNQGYGFDTSYDDRQSESADFLTFFRQYYDANHADIAADFVVCRHVLEHVDNPVEFLRNLGSIPSWSEDTVVYFEVPNGMWSFKDLGIWDFIYEHFSYFNATSLDLAFRLAGYEVLDVREGFGGQYLCIEARWKGEADATLHSAPTEVLQCLSELNHRYDEKIGQWKTQLEGFKQGGYAIWGAGSKGVSFANLLGGTDGRFLVDVNPGKQGRFVPGTGQLIKAPEQLSAEDAATYVVMNPNYQQEIQQTLRDAGIDAVVTSA